VFKKQKFSQTQAIDSKPEPLADPGAPNAVFSHFFRRSLRSRLILSIIILEIWPKHTKQLLLLQPSYLQHFQWFLAKYWNHVTHILHSFCAMKKQSTCSNNHCTARKQTVLFSWVHRKTQKYMFSKCLLRHDVVRVFVSSLVLVFVRAILSCCP